MVNLSSGQDVADVEGGGSVAKEEENAEGSNDAKGKVVGGVELEEKAEADRGEGVDTRMDKPDTKVSAFPVFCLTKPTEEYRAEVDEFASRFNVNYLEVTSNESTRDRLVAEIDAISNENDGGPSSGGPFPFIDSDIDSIGQFWSRTLRPADDSVALEPFASNTYLIIDQAGIEASPYPEIVVCTNAPDYDNLEEDENGLNALKMIRLPIPLAFRMLNSLDALTATPSEALDLEDTADALCSFPPFTMKKASGGENAEEQNEYTPATPLEARTAKRRALRMRPENKWDKVLDHEREAVLFLTPFTEASVAAIMHRLSEAQCRILGYKMRYRDNRTEGKKEEMRREREAYEEGVRRGEDDANEEVGGDGSV